MTNQEAIDILTRHNAWRRDNETEFTGGVPRFDDEDLPF